MKTRLLVVDDENEIRDMISRHFRFLGYDVDTASNGQEALEKLALTRTEVVISDIVMPKMDGVTMLKTISQNYPMVHAIMISGYVTLDNALACMRYGADTFIFKPIEDMRELEIAVDNAVENLKRWQQKLKVLQNMKPTV